MGLTIVDRVTQVAVAILGAFFGVLLGIDLAIKCALKPSMCRRIRERPAPPQVTSDYWGEHGYVSANGVKFHYVANGPANAPLMLCLHGFPECWYSWRYILAAFGHKYRVVAVDLRGYGETAHAESSWWTADDYRMRVLVADVAALISALGYQKCTLVSHDWGGIIAWAFAYAHASMLDSLVVMNSPHPLAFRDTMTLAQLLRSYYVFVFQYPWAPELWLKANDYAFLDGAFLGGPMAVRRKGEPLALNASDVAVYKWVFSRAGTLTAAANYYRNIFGDNVVYQREIGIRKSNPMTVKTLLIWGENDGALGVDSPKVTSKYVPELTLRIIPNASHWVQQDAVMEVINHLGAFLGVQPRPLPTGGVVPAAVAAIETAEQRRTSVSAAAGAGGTSDAAGAGTPPASRRSSVEGDGDAPPSSGGGRRDRGHSSGRKRK